MKERFESSGTVLGLIKNFQVWQNCTTPLPISLKKTDLLIEHFELIHCNPVRDKIVDIPGEYVYSSARDYSGMKGIVNIKKILPVEKYLAASQSMNGTFFVKYIRN